MNTTTYRFLGNTDEVTSCDCCGRADLKSTVALEDESGNVVHFGVVCAARAVKVTAKEVRSLARTADQTRAEVEAAHRRAIWEAEYNELQAFLDRHVGALRDFGGKPDRARQLELAGGMAAARAAFAAEVA